MEPRASAAALDLDLRPWRMDDLGLMERLMGDPAMTVHLGGPESPERVRARLTRYVELGPATGRMFVITVGADRVPAGTVGFWPHDAHGEPALETGWSVLREFQGRGVATQATMRCLDLAAEAGGHAAVHAYPAVENAASNAVCRKVGFEWMGTTEVEYPRGHAMTVNDWRLDLEAWRRRSGG